MTGFRSAKAVEKFERQHASLSSPRRALESPRPLFGFSDSTGFSRIAITFDFRPGILLDAREVEDGRRPVSLMGKAFCKVDAKKAPSKWATC